MGKLRMHVFQLSCERASNPIPNPQPIDSGGKQVYQDVWGLGLGKMAFFKVFFFLLLSPPLRTTSLSGSALRLILSPTRRAIRSKLPKTNSFRDPRVMCLVTIPVYLAGSVSQVWQAYIYMRSNLCFGFAVSNVTLRMLLCSHPTDRSILHLLRVNNLPLRRIDNNQPLARSVSFAEAAGWMNV